MNNRYFSAEEAEQFTFFRIPKALMTQPEYKGISVEAKFLYGLLLDRMGLSVKNGWCEPCPDGSTRVYIYFTIQHAVEELSCGRSKAIRLYQELERAGLIERDRQGCGSPSKIFVKDFRREVSKPNREKSENKTSESPDSEPLEVSKPDANKKNNNQTELNEIHPSISMEDLTDEIREQLEYEILVERYPLRRDRIDEVIRLIADTLCSRAATIRLNGADVPRDYVESRFRELSFEHVEYVFDRMDETPSDIRNIRAYLLTALYNAPVTMDSYYTAQVYRDMPWLARTGA